VFPERLKALIPQCLETEPLDPMNAAGTPLKYRRDSLVTAIVWTVGFDGIDDGGDTEDEACTDECYRIQLLDEAKWLAKTNEPVPTDD
jgi:hypothetical protein